MLDRRAQFHQDVLSGNMQGTNPHFQGALHRITHMLMMRGPDSSVHAAVQAQGMMYQELQRQAMMMSFVDNFRTMAIICLLVIPLMLVMKGRK